MLLLLATRFVPSEEEKKVDEERVAKKEREREAERKKGKNWLSWLNNADKIDLRRLCARVSFTYIPLSIFLSLRVDFLSLNFFPPLSISLRTHLQWSKRRHVYLSPVSCFLLMNLANLQREDKMRATLPREEKLFSSLPSEQESN